MRRDSEKVDCQVGTESKTCGILTMKEGEIRKKVSSDSADLGCVKHQDLGKRLLLLGQL